MIPQSLPTELLDAAETATKMIEALTNDVTEAQDNLLLTKITQSHHADASRAPDPNYKVNELVMLSAGHRCHEYKRKGDK